jgi:minor extracellular serine protease Vpr
MLNCLRARGAGRTLAGATVAIVAGLIMASAGAAGNAPEPAGSGDVAPSYYTPLGMSNAPVNVVVQLGGDPVTVTEANSGKKLGKSEKEALAAGLKGKQDALAGAIAALGGQVTGNYQYAYNGIRVRISARDADKLAALSGVTGVHRLQLMKPDNVRSVPFIGAPAVWDGLNGLHGEGVKIAVIDTGIDYTHANFNGPGTVAAYTEANARDTLPADPTMFGPNAPRVKGGIDLVGDAYNAAAAAGSPALIPHPDPNPLDCNGHGSHVAGTAAGTGVDGTGHTYSGPYNANTVSSNSWVIGPGVAPKADIYSVRVFGCTGSTDVTVDAIEWAVANGMDVINMSLGSPLGGSDDPSAVASTNAARDGVIVVTSAGNNGPSQYIVGSPSTADGAISTAASDSWSSTPGASVVTSAVPGPALSLTAVNANGYNFTGPITGGLVVLKDNPATTTDQAGYVGSADESLGCSPSAYTYNGAAGKIAVAKRGTCARVARAVFGQQAGAIAVIMTNNAASLPPFEGPITSNPDTGESYTVTIPFLGIGGNQTVATSDSGKMQAQPAGQTVTLSAASITNPNFRGFASFSSGGPRTGDSALKPDLTAPGVSISSTANGTGNGAAFISGTSMASPHAAGVAVLTRQAHPSWSVADIKAAMINTGDPSGVFGYRTSLGGTGLVQPAKSVATQSVAYPAGGTPFDVALNFGLQELKSDFSQTKSVKIDNNGSSAATFNVTQAGASGSPHAVSFSASSVTVPAHSSATVDVTLNVPAATAGSANGSGLSFHEVAGLVTLTPAAGSNNGVTLRVPYYLVPRPQAAVSTKINLQVGATATATVSNKADAPIAGDADFYAWGLADGKDRGNAANDVRAIGTQSFPFPSGTNPLRRLIVFAVNTYDGWSNASTNEFDIYVDVNGDGVDDYIVVGADQGAVQTGTYNGIMGAFVFSTRSPGAAINFLATAPTDGSTAELPVLSSALCRAGEPCLNGTTNARISYHAVSFDVANGGVDEVDGTARYNPWHEAITTGGFAAGVAPGASDSSNNVAIDSAEWALTPAMGLMIVTLDNKNGTDEAQLVGLKK